MSKAVMLSIRPKWCEKIARGEKTIEVRKTRPKLDTPFRCYIYCTIGGQDLNIPISQERLMRDYLETGSMKSLNCPLGNGKVIGEFTCDRIYELETKARGGSYYVKNEDQPTTNFIVRQSCLGLKDMHGYGWHITDLRIYDAPRELREFTGLRNTRFGAAPYDIKRAPQSWCYVEAMKKEQDLSVKKMCHWRLRKSVLG